MAVNGEASKRGEAKEALMERFGKGRKKKGRGKGRKGKGRKGRGGSSTDRY